MKKFILCCFLTALPFLFLDASLMAQSNPQANPLPLPVNLFSQNGWKVDTIWPGTGTVTSYPDCPGMGVTPNIPCLVDANKNIYKNNRWLDVKNTSAKLVRFGGTTADQNKPSRYEYLRFVDSVRAKGMEPILQIPVNGDGADGTQGYDTTWAKVIISYINSTKARNVKYWIIGNEPNEGLPGGYGYGNSNTAHDYIIATYIKNFSKAMRRAVPSVPIYIIGPELSYVGADPNDPMHKLCDSLLTPNQRCDITGKDPATNKYWIDYFSFHSYSWNPSNQTNLRDSIITHLRTSKGLAGQLSYLKTIIDNANSTQSRTSSPIKIAITEANIDSQTDTTDTFTGVKTHSFIAGQYWLEIASVAADYGVDFVCFWSATETSMGYIRNSTGAKNSTYHHFKVLADNFKGCTNYYLGTDNDYYLKAFGAKATNKMVVVVMNQDTVGTQDKIYRIRLDNVDPGTIYKINVNMGVGALYNDTIKASSTTVLVFDCNGSIAYKYRYDQAGQWTPFQSVWAASSPAQIITADLGPDKQVGPCCLTTITSSPSISGANYEWRYSGDNYASVLQTGSSNSYTSAGATYTYKVIVTKNGCSVEDYINITQKSTPTCCNQSPGGRMANSETNMPAELLDNVPNPTDGKTTINYTLGSWDCKAEIRIVDIYGKTIDIIPVSKDKTSVEFNCTNCANGIYFYSLIVGEQLIGTKKMVIAK